MRNPNIDLPFIEHFSDGDKPPRLGLLGRAIVRFSKEGKSRIETVKHDAFSALNRLVETFGTDDEKGVWVESTQYPEAFPKVFIGPLAGSEGRHRITFWDSKRNRLDLEEVEAPTGGESPYFKLVHERQTLDFDELPVSQRVPTLVVLDTFATTISEEENKHAFQATSGLF